MNCYSRTATGVIVMRLKEGALIYNFTCLPSEEKIEEEAEAGVLADAEESRRGAMTETGSAFDEPGTPTETEE